ncbi:transcriptional regulator, TetR family [Virgibacillus subterraneus]|uniref:Transcriptional regulator, TetR family n=2 Tax=Virgibacillus TaxID=84406 RepID=A0A1H1FU79_9BACI|nr:MULTISPECIES: TetR/AcrR family transcriptional regulator [Virgibacillus]SDR04066.1 transcriptional regulator, TetR family [Virgibacillus salinus]SEQ74650.1 transcriptional regulator, TetR family [Virgibacillus subterraneus]
MAARKAVVKELTREMIMNAARDLFVEKGYQSVSMRQIAKVLNYSHGAIYYHFKNKAELFYALVEDHFIMLDSMIDELVLEEIEDYEKLRNILMGYIEFGLTHQSHYEIMFLVKDEEVRTFINESPMQTYQKFAYYVSQLSDKHLTVQEIWSIFLSLHGFVTHYIRHVANFKDAKSMAEAHVNLLLEWTKR